MDLIGVLKGRHKKFAHCILLCTILLLTGCRRELIGINNEYILPERLASYHVRTPDPRQDCPPIGQRLNVYWCLGPEFKSYQHLFLELRLLFRDHKEETVTIEVNKPCGFYFYDLLNEDYFAKQGILTYKLTLYADGEILEEWHHQLWTELIQFTNKEKKP